MLKTVFLNLTYIQLEKYYKKQSTCRTLPIYIPKTDAVVFSSLPDATSDTKQWMLLFRKTVFRFIDCGFYSVYCYYTQFRAKCVLQIRSAKHAGAYNKCFFNPLNVFFHTASLSQNIIYRI